MLGEGEGEGVPRIGDCNMVPVRSAGDERQPRDAQLLGGSHHGPSDPTGHGQWLSCARAQCCTSVCPVCDVASPYMQYKTREDQKRTDLMARVRVSGGTHKAGVYVQLETIAWHIAKCTKLNTG